MVDIGPEAAPAPEPERQLRAATAYDRERRAAAARKAWITIRANKARREAEAA
jgi:hypothetical protein